MPAFFDRQASNPVLNFLDNGKVLMNYEDAYAYRLLFLTAKKVGKNICRNNSLLINLLMSIFSPTDS